MHINGHEFEAAIFDFDGTLADSMWVWNDVDARFFAKRAIAIDPAAIEQVAVLGFESGADYVIEHFGLDESPESIIEEWKCSAYDGYAHRVALKPGAREYVLACKRGGTPLAVATSLQRNLLEPALRNNGVLELFDALCVCDELHCGGKSTPAVYLEAARLMGVEPARCVVFEDVARAARSAQETGAYVVGVYDGHEQQDTAELARVADFFIESWEQLL